MAEIRDPFRVLGLRRMIRGHVWLIGIVRLPTIKEYYRLKREAISNGD